MKLITPPMASEPYKAEAPSFSTSTRSMAPAGMLLRSTPASSPGDTHIENILTQLRSRQIAMEQIETYARQQDAAVKERELEDRLADRLL